METNIEKRAMAVLADPAAACGGTRLRKDKTPLLDGLRRAFLLRGAVLVAVAAASALAPGRADAGLLGSAVGAVAGGAVSGEASSLSRLSELSVETAMEVGTPSYQTKLAETGALMERHKVVGRGTVSHALRSAVAKGQVRPAAAQQVASDLGIDPAKVLANGPGDEAAPAGRDPFSGR
jgi:hypothetical protein